MSARPLRMLIVDDEAVCRSALVSYLSRTPTLAAAVEIHHADSAKQACELLVARRFDLVVTDVDMGSASINGFELVKDMRAQGVEALICVHSNRIVAADHKTAIAAGADAFLPKPVARAHLLKLVLQAQERCEQAHAVPMSPALERQGAIAKPEVLIVDDNWFILDAWGESLGGEAVVHKMASLEELNLRLTGDPGFARRLLVAVTDLHLDGSAGDGFDVGRLLKKAAPAMKVLLSSDAIVAKERLVGAIDATIGKEPVALHSLLKMSEMQL